MNTAIKLNTETIETVMTYSEWERIHTQKARKRKAERTYYIKQKLSGLTMATIGIITPILLDGDCTFSLFALPVGIWLLFTKEKVMMFWLKRKQNREYIKRMENKIYPLLLLENGGYTDGKRILQ